MIKNDEIKTTGRQRILIVAIAVFMLLSTFALYASIVMSANPPANTASNDEKTARFNQLYQQYLDAVAEQTKQLSSEYFDEMLGYKSNVRAFNAADVHEVKTKDLKVGDGPEVTGTDFIDYSAYYIGWLSDESIFDSSFNDKNNPTSLREPLAGSPNMIQGWLEGLVGMKIGGVREITIPAELGYGSTEQDGIPANSPLKFIVKLIEPVQDPYFDGAEELQQLIEELYN